MLLVLNITSIYRYAIYKYDLTKLTGLSIDTLMENYRRTIYYIQNPFIKELNFSSIPMSEFARIHFWEVKRIFIALYIFSIAFIILIIIKGIKNRNNDFRKKIVKSFNGGVNVAAIIFVLISASAVVDFSKAFYFFHKIFFKNNYWIFDPKIDPIIIALPEEFFMIEFAMIVAILVVFTIVVKVLNIRLNKAYEDK